MTTFTCDPNTGGYLFDLWRWSNPNAKYLNIATGTTLKNQVAQLDARLAEAKVYYQTKTAPMVKAAIQKATE